MSNFYLLLGKVYHQRFRPKENKFSYPTFCLRGDVQEIMRSSSWIFGVGRKFPFGILPRDYLDKESDDLHLGIQTFLRKHQLWSDAFSSIELQTYPAVLGFVFNPVSFWYCLDSAKNLIAVLVEVNNTFGERHFYWVQDSKQQPITETSQLEVKKNFHVSPFFPVQGHYQFKFLKTDQKQKVTINYYNDSNELELVTYIDGTKTDINSSIWLRCLLTYGWMTALVVIRIHWQAMKLLFKRAKFHRLPPLPKQEVTTWNKNKDHHGKSDSF